MAMEILELQIYYRDKDTDELQKVVRIPSAQSADAIKIDVAKVVKEIKHKAEYYYMTIKVARSDGTFGYRTMIPKTLVS